MHWCLAWGDLRSHAGQPDHMDFCPMVSVHSDRPLKEGWDKARLPSLLLRGLR